VKKFILLLTLLVFNTSLFSQNKISDRLFDAMNNVLENRETVQALVILSDRVDIRTLDQDLYARKVSLEERAQTVITLLQQKARRTQPEIISLLESKSSDEVKRYQGYWINNMTHCAN
jgi:hypothetical protein